MSDTSLLDLGVLARRLAEATDPLSAAEWFAEQLKDRIPGAAVRVYVFGPCDRHPACRLEKTCTAHDRCLHLAAAIGSFELPQGLAERIPRTTEPWSGVLGAEGLGADAAVPVEITTPAGSEGWATLLPLAAGGEVIGVLALRTADRLAAESLGDVRLGCWLAAAALRILEDRAAERRRLTQLLLVNELGRKVNSILDAELLLRQAAADVHRTFGFHNVMIYTMEPGRRRLLLGAHAARLTGRSDPPQSLPLDQGVVGRAARNGSTETVDDVAGDRDFVPWFEDTRSEIAVPILVDGIVEGVINVESDRVAAFGASERLVLETVANQLAIALQNARLFAMVREREDRYRALVESNPAAVLHLDAEERIIYVNPAVVEVTGYDKTDILSRRWALTDLCPEDERAMLRAAVRDALQGIPRRALSFTVLRQDGARRWVSASLQPIADDDSSARSVVVLLSDETEDRELEERLRQSEKLSSLGTLVSGVAHELNNPLAGILGYAQLLLDRPSEQWTRPEVEKIERNAHRCQRIVENLLAFARQSRMTKRLANLNDVVQSVVRLNEYQFRMDDVDIQTSFDPRVTPLHLDVMRWQQVFVNLATNARDAMVAAGAKPRILRFETRLHDTDLVIRVSDTGPGIPEGLRARIFEPFFTTKETGTGLGLGICWGIVRDHGGTIEVEPSAHGGAVFRITVPTEHPEVAPLEPPVAAEPALTELGQGKRVLVVDDDASVRDVVVRALENHRYKVDAAGDGRHALENVRAAPYDVVLTDVRMPGDMDGIDFFERVRDELPHLASRVVFLTGNTLDPEGMDRLERLGVRCVEKPFDIHHLARVVHDVAALPPSGAAEPAPA